MEYELERMKHQVRPARSREFLFEVFVGPQSQLTSQCIRKQRSARRYGLPACDLESEAGRQRLFTDLLGHQPQHIWFAPVCRPWSAWSNLNGARSLEAFDDLQQKRQDMLGQLALGIVLLRYQVDHGRHLHWEQPSTSLMLRLPGLREIRENTLAATFDMCRVGDLRDPATGQPMRKRTTVLTTLPALWETLDARYCLGDHEHQNLEGSTTTMNQQILRTSFAEHYTRKFARQVVQILGSFKGSSQRSQWQARDVALATRAQGPEAETSAPKRLKCQEAAEGIKRSSTAVSPVYVPGALEKRRRIDGKQHPSNAGVGEWTQILRDISAITPRVGKTQVTDSKILQDLAETVA